MPGGAGFSVTFFVPKVATKYRCTLGSILYSLKVVTQYGYILGSACVVETHLGSKSVKRELWEKTVVIT